MRRYTIFLPERDFRKLEKKIEETGTDLAPQQYLNLVVAKFLGAKVPTNKSKWREFLEKRKGVVNAEPYRAEKVGEGERYVDKIAIVLSKASDPMTKDEISKASGLPPGTVSKVLRNYPKVFEAVNQKDRRHFEPLQWVLLIDLN